MSMEAYRFETIVQKNGIIQVPEIANLAYKQVKVFIMVNPTIQEKLEKPCAVDVFLDKWQGFLKGVNPDETKRNYLEEKYA